MKTLLLALTLFCALAAVAADRDQALSLLQGYEWSASETAERLPGGAASLLLDIARDDAVDPLTRERATATLTHFPGNEVLSFYLARLDDAPRVERRRIVEALCQGFAESHPQALKSALIPMLEADDAHLRVRAAACLRQETFGAPEALMRYRSRVSGSWEARAAGFEGGIR